MPPRPYVVRMSRSLQPSAHLHYPRFHYALSLWSLLPNVQWSNDTDTQTSAFRCSAAHSHVGRPTDGHTHAHTRPPLHTYHPWRTLEDKSYTETNALYVYVCACALCVREPVRESMSASMSASISAPIQSQRRATPSSGRDLWPWSATRRRWFFDRVRAWLRRSLTRQTARPSHASAT